MNQGKQVQVTSEKLVTCTYSICAPDRSRTYDLRYRKPVLYPLSYGGEPSPSPVVGDDNGVILSPSTKWKAISQP